MRRHTSVRRSQAGALRLSWGLAGAQLDWWPLFFDECACNYYFEVVSIRFKVIDQNALSVRGSYWRLEFLAVGCCRGCGLDALHT